MFQACADMDWYYPEMHPYPSYPYCGSFTNVPQPMCPAQAWPTPYQTPTDPAWYVDNECPGTFGEEYFKWPAPEPEVKPPRTEASSPMSAGSTPSPSGCDKPCGYESTSLEPAFAQRFDIFLQGSEETTIFCAVCQDSTAIKYNGKAIVSECGHYVACNECRTRIIRQILRCPSCCRSMANEYAVCGSECEEVSQLLSSGLSTSQCPRCCQKLAKSTCGKTCNRTDTKEYKRAYKKLLTCVGTMVLKPEICEKPEFPGERPCSHFSKCREHGTITRGRAHQPRCPQCKTQRKKERRFSSVSNQYVPGMFEVKWG